MLRFKLVWMPSSSPVFDEKWMGGMSRSANQRKAAPSTKPIAATAHGGMGPPSDIFIAGLRETRSCSNHNARCKAEHHVERSLIYCFKEKLNLSQVRHSQVKGLQKR